ncbi:MAG: hypothetical protein EOP53_17605 [Sphingobacteriales bacterium]|nr:MAG: hypothetical protein EOP53_17605 [Sphingobacteriales bacterium]
MLEIIALIFLTKNIGEKATRKGLPPGRWKLYTVLAWFGAEVLGFILGAMLFGNENLIGLMLFAMVCAVGGYLLIKYNIDKYPDNPDSLDDDINRIGNN